ncbi:hypothetical protein ONZ45_g12347 [Pleurotus djamor]|nr:hypothetical protein ONZ45_g12347 [Pleurotus djamor]
MTLLLGTASGLIHSLSHLRRIVFDILGPLFEALYLGARSHRLILGLFCYALSDAAPAAQILPPCHGPPPAPPANEKLTPNMVCPLIFMLETCFTMRRMKISSSTWLAPENLPQIFADHQHGPSIALVFYAPLSSPSNQSTLLCGRDFASSQWLEPFLWMLEMNHVPSIVPALPYALAIVSGVLSPAKLPSRPRHQPFGLEALVLRHFVHAAPLLDRATNHLPCIHGPVPAWITRRKGPDAYLGRITYGRGRNECSRHASMKLAPCSCSRRWVHSPSRPRHQPPTLPFLMFICRFRRGLLEGRNRMLTQVVSRMVVGETSGVASIKLLTTSPPSFSSVYKTLAVPIPASGTHTKATQVVSWFLPYIIFILLGGLIALGTGPMLMNPYFERRRSLIFSTAPPTTSRSIAHVPNSLASTHSGPCLRRCLLPFSTAPPTTNPAVSDAHVSVPAWTTRRKELNAYPSRITYDCGRTESSRLDRLGPWFTNVDVHPLLDRATNHSSSIILHPPSSLYRATNHLTSAVAVCNIGLFPVHPPPSLALVIANSGSTPSNNPKSPSPTRVPTSKDGALCHRSIPIMGYVSIGLSTIPTRREGIKYLPHGGGCMIIHVSVDNHPLLTTTPASTVFASVVLNLTVFLVDRATNHQPPAFASDRGRFLLD